MDAESGKSTRPRDGGERSTMVTIVAVALLTLLTAALIAFLIDDSASNVAHKVPSGTLTKEEKTGRELFAQNCANCHMLEAVQSAGPVGPSLDAIKPSAAIVENAIRQGRSSSRGVMPPGLLSGEDAKRVAAFVERAVAQSQ